MDSESRWCEQCFEDTLHTIVKYYIGTRKTNKGIKKGKIIFGYRCEICGETTTLKPRFDVFISQKEWDDEKIQRFLMCS